jgi:hypothetical protein
MLIYVAYGEINDLPDMQPVRIEVVAHSTGRSRAERERDKSQYSCIMHHY